MATVKNKPLVYSCSGCSNVAQLANDVAIELDRRGVAEMSCIAGVGGNVPALVKVAKSGRPIIGLDGCPLSCVKQCLQQHQVTADYHCTLNQTFRVTKRNGQKCEASQVVAVADHVEAEIHRLIPSALQDS